METLYYTVKEIKEKERCGRDKAYEIAKMLPHEKRGRDIFVFAEDYENYYRDKRRQALERSELERSQNTNVYQLRKIY